ncbi:TGM1 glutamyltransferase, partial [Steatornis caripensis]|nr:TGM1 glutamyltransferase [Steatornis caripensis]
LTPHWSPGVSGAPFRQEQHRCTMPPGQGEARAPGSPRCRRAPAALTPRSPAPAEETVTMTVAYAEYGPHVGDQDALKLTAAGTVEETGQVVAKELRVR